MSIPISYLWELTQQELDQALKCLRQSRDGCAHCGERGLDDAEDRIEDGLEDSQNGAEDRHDGVEDAGDQRAELIEKRRHVCGRVRLMRDY